MSDRESVFRDSKIIQLLTEKFVPVGFDQWYSRRQQDAEGEFYRKIALQSPRNDFSQTTQGFYIATPDGELCSYRNHRDPKKVLSQMKSALTRFAPVAGATLPIQRLPEHGENGAPRKPDGASVVQVNAKVLGGYLASSSPRRRIFQTAISRDNLWIERAEVESIAAGVVPPSLLYRLARFHLVDGTRGEPPMWRKSEVRHVTAELETDGEFRGTFHLETADGERGFRGEFRGFLASDGGQFSQFDVVAQGDFWGEGQYTQGAPVGRFPFAVAFRVPRATAAGTVDVSDRVAPQGLKGWSQQYWAADQ